MFVRNVGLHRVTPQKTRIQVIYCLILRFFGCETDCNNGDWKIVTNLGRANVEFVEWPYRSVNNCNGRNRSRRGNCNILHFIIPKITSCPNQNTQPIGITILKARDGHVNNILNGFTSVKLISLWGRFNISASLVSQRGCY
jgi:hypothetical protein